MTLKNITMGPPFIILKSHMNFGNLSIFCSFWNCFLQWKCRISKSNEIVVRTGIWMKIQMQHDTGSGSMVHASFFITLVTNYILLLFFIHTRLFSLWLQTRPITDQQVPRERKYNQWKCRGTENKVENVKRLSTLFDWPNFRRNLRIRESKVIQSLTKAIIFELFSYINGYFRV